ncbi:hypothetical protein NDU88_004394 [Pleurodeles waltl]|uniref:Uncharacterized protein n=1 Tax=Pleurodeles waltl TaxID=8319 RepID=A0AAV7T7N4_PLEWA|nr:hypothetical protein NDU88_004394 [Pleurodeles waltl]
MSHNHTSRANQNAGGHRGTTENTRAHTHWTPTKKAGTTEKAGRHTRSPEDNDKATWPQPKLEDSAGKKQLLQSRHWQRKQEKYRKTPSQDKDAGQRRVQGETKGASNGTAKQSSPNIPHPPKAQSNQRQKRNQCPEVNVPSNQGQCPRPGTNNPTDTPAKPPHPDRPSVSGTNSGARGDRGDTDQMLLHQPPQRNTGS